VDLCSAERAYRDDTPWGGTRRRTAQPGEEVYDADFEALVHPMLVRLGENPDREGLHRTPLRVAKALDFLTSGYAMDAAEVFRDALFSEDCKEMVVIKDIEFYSLCEHHMLPFFRRAHVAYLPAGKMIELSKVARVVDLLALAAFLSVALVLAILRLKKRLD